jgi:hypothetical protein
MVRWDYCTLCINCIASVSEIANTMEKVKVMTFRLYETADSLRIEVD